MPDGGEVNIPAVMIRIEDGETDKKITSSVWKVAGLTLDYYDAKKAKNTYELGKGETLAQAEYAVTVPLSVSEVGCYYSHYRVWKMALEKAWPCVLVLEEDAHPTDCFRTVVRHALEIKDPDAAVMLFHEVQKKSQTIYTWKDGVRLTKLMEKGAYSAMGYILFRGALQKLVSRMNVCRMPMDYFYDFSFLTRVNSYTLKPYAVKNSKKYHSYLEKERGLAYNVLKKASLKKRISRRINREVGGRILSQEYAGRLIEKDWHSEIICADEPKKSKLQIVVIALEPDKYKESKYMKEWMKYGIHPTIFCAVDGRKCQPLLQPDEKLYFTGLNTKAVMEEFYKPQNTEIGCYFSHLRLWKWALERDIERLLVIEEDVMPCANIREALRSLDFLDYDIINLLRFWYSESTFYKQISTGFMTAQPVEDGWSTGCYMATELAMKRWVEKLATMSMPVDHALHLSRQTCRLRAVELRPYPVIMNLAHQSAIEIERDIYRKHEQKERLRHHDRYKRKLRELKERARSASWRYIFTLLLRLRQPGDGSE